MKFKPDFALRSEKQLISYFIKYGIFKNENEINLIKKKIILFLMNTSQKKILNNLDQNLMIYIDYTRLF